MTLSPESHSEPNGIVNLLILAGRLKRLRRQGWIDRGVTDPESVADHSYRLALMVLVTASQRPDIDTERALWLALVHDLPEALAGDVTPFDDKLNVADLDRVALFHQAPEYSHQADIAKTEAEREALARMTEDLPEELASRLRDAWEEYEAGESAEAKLVRQLDKLETWLQAVEYHAEQPEVIIESFRLGTQRDVTDTPLLALLDAINRRFQR